jgi:ectoine hydroxylase-related dioxygenase (phytanoyl-CoA dioxygenase family)
MPNTIYNKSFFSNKRNAIAILTVLIIILFFIYLFVVVYNTKERVVNHYTNYDLDKDGVCVMKQVLNPNEIEFIKQNCELGNYEKVKTFLSTHPNIQNHIQECVHNTDYVLQDYIWIIQKSSVHTCHRDNNGQFFNEGQKYPSYTLLIYMENMERCLGVLPQSHLNKNSYNVNFTNDLVHLLCNAGDAVLFNANLIHVGAINESGDDHLRIQMKVTHKDDLDKLSYYQNFNKVLKEDNTVPRKMRQMQKNMSCMFPGISDMTQQDNIMSARGSDNGANIGWAQKVFSQLFYGRSDFYDLPNAF